MAYDLGGACLITTSILLRSHIFCSPGKSILRDTNHMTEEPRSLNSASSPFLHMDPAALRTFTTSRSTTDVRALRTAPNGNGHPYDAGVQNGGGKNTVRVKTSVQPMRNCEANRSSLSLHASHVPTLQYAGTQSDQDVTDAEARKNIMKDLMKSWMDRLQLISVIVRVACSGVVIFLLPLYRQPSSLRQRGSCWLSRHQPMTTHRRRVSEPPLMGFLLVPSSSTCVQVSPSGR